MSSNSIKQSPEHKDNFSKMSLEQLHEVFERQSNILKNKKLVENLPDKGKQLEEKLDKIKNELKLREDFKNIEQTMEQLSITSNRLNDDSLNQEKHIQHICSLERTPEKDRYKPFQTLNKKNTDDIKPTQLIPLAESMTLLTEQSKKLPGDEVRLKIEGDETDESENEDEMRKAKMIELS